MCMYVRWSQQCQSFAAAEETARAAQQRMRYYIGQSVRTDFVHESVSDQASAAFQNATASAPAAASPMCPVRASSADISSCAMWAAGTASGGGCSGCGRSACHEQTRTQWQSCTCPHAVSIPEAAPACPATPHLVLRRQAGIVMQRRCRPALIGACLGNTAKASVHRAAVPGCGHQPAQLLQYAGAPGRCDTQLAACRHMVRALHEPAAQPRQRRQQLKVYCAGLCAGSPVPAGSHHHRT